jgi:enamine deaminase RidA (YjgF/YER057c/UK114 family)
MKEDAVSQTRFINPEGLSKPPGYTHVVEVTSPGRIVYVAGQLGGDRGGKFSSDFRLQAIQTFENLKRLWMRSARNFSMW